MKGEGQSNVFRDLARWQLIKCSRLLLVATLIITRAERCMSPLDGHFSSFACAGGCCSRHSGIQRYSFAWQRQKARENFFLFSFFFLCLLSKQWMHVDRRCQTKKKAYHFADTRAIVVTRITMNNDKPRKGVLVLALTERGLSSAVSQAGYDKTITFLSSQSSGNNYSRLSQRDLL